MPNIHNRDRIFFAALHHEGKSLQQKWKNIRTSFTREVKRRAGAKNGSVALHKSPYVYFDQLQFLRQTVVNNTTQSSMDETRNGETNDESGNIQIRSLVSKKKNKTEEESVVEILKDNIAVREERERQQKSDSDRFFMLSLLEDF
ncbi:hypothetical protein FQA39_LY06738 [Lamprigera yunnana]|nr:hypothetical protein FQA39_LY06738 [Lamprigera yunnana]